MTGKWWHRLVVGVALIIVALVMVPRFPGNGQFYQPIVFPGIAVGAVLALVPAVGIMGRTAAFLLGGATGTGIFLARGLVFPQTPTGVAMAVSVGLLILTIIAVASKGYWPMWAGLLGWLLVEAAYEARFAVQPTLVTSDVFAYLAPSLTAAAVAYIVTLVLMIIFREDRLALPSDTGTTLVTPPGHTTEVYEDSSTVAIQKATV